MKRITNLTIGKKLNLGFSAMILLATIIGFVGYKSSKNINRNLTEILDVRLPALDYLIEADRDLQQLLVAERSMLNSETDSNALKGFLKDYEENLVQSEERWKKYKALAVAPEERELLPEYESARREWQLISKKAIDEIMVGTSESRKAALQISLGDAKEKFEGMRNYLDLLTEVNLELAGEKKKRASETYDAAVVAIFAITGCGFMVGVALMYFVGGGIIKILKSLAEDLSDASQQVASGSDQISQSSQQLAQRASEQAASIEETSASLEEMSSMTRQNAENAGLADNLMKKVNNVVVQSNESMKELTFAMQKISGASEETSKIIKTIDEIAFQTNLLALNAAVEAARAGEAGAGFAVVAGEVRNLAMRAAEAAQSTSELIEGTVKSVNQGSELASRTNGAFGQVTENASKVSALIAEIAAASREQAQGISQINTAVSEMDKITQHNAANAEQSSSASAEMNSQAEQMERIVDKLTSLVKKSKNGAKQGPLYDDKPFHPRKPAAMEFKRNEKKGGKASVRNQQELSPEEIFPLNDDDFKDF